MLTQEDKDWVNQKITAQTQYSSRVVGDTPTDALQLVPKKYLNSRFFSGQVTALGAAVSLPTGWTSAAGGDGQAVITHNINTTAYDVVPAVYTENGVIDNGYAAVIYDKSANSFTIQNTVNGVRNTLANFFILIKRP